ncbi:MAG: polyprenyl synthetase family protein [Candidatus Aenigmatarchaeota archaeon]|nr:MAG: polyprenyl synthetase family protein [Candidatus Aenigmarchaeota archaeon]
MESEIMEFLKGKKKTIDEAIAKYLPKNVDEKYIKWLLGKPSYEYTTKTIQEALSKPIWEFLTRGGKRWRPALFLLFNEALGGDAAKVKDFTATLELLHEGSIMIDDIEDSSDLRRGKPCTHKIFGEDIAINAGNFMYFLAFFPLIKNRDKFNEKTLLRAWQTTLEEITRIHYGQASDIAWHKGLADADSINEREYMQMCAYKTGVLARLAARLAVILNDGSEELEEKLGGFSESIGVAFQIQDDIMNIAPTKGWGKETGDDINEGKRTLLVIHTLKKADKKDAQRLLLILEMHTKDRKLIGEAINIIKKYGAVEYSKKFARNMVRKAWKEVEELIPGGEAKKKLEAFAMFAIEREI